MAPKGIRAKFRLSRPIIQNMVVGTMLFCLPGIYVAITGLGAGGGQPSSLTVANNVNAILYAIFAVMSLGVGSILNILTPKICLMIGAFGYPFYVGGLWFYDRTGNSALAYAAGVILGFSSAFLWTTASFISYAYPEEHRKGLYISMQWAIRSGGATTGALIAFGSNFHQTSAAGVSTPVYATYVAIQTCAIFIAFFFIINPRKVVRDDGTHLAVFSRPTLASEGMGLVNIFFDPKYLILAIPMFCCEMALGLASSVNSRCFNLRTRTLNNVSFQAIQFVCPPLLTWILDNKHIKSRRKRGLIGILVMGANAVGACCGLLAWLAVNNVDSADTGFAWDWTDPQFGGLFVVYTMFGACFSGYQMATEWTLAATTNDPERLAKIAGMFKFWSSLGMFVSFIMAAQGVPYYGQTALQLSCYTVGIGCITWILFTKIPQTNYFSEANVIVPTNVEEKARLDGKVDIGQLPTEHEKQQEAQDTPTKTATAQENQDNIERP